MSSGIRGPADFWAGLIYVAFGVTAVVIARDYGAGSALRMGPGYFPMLLGGVLTLIGLISIARSFRSEGETMSAPNLRAMLFIAIPIVLFAMILRGAGLVIALPLLIISSAYASAHFKLLPTLLMAAGLTAFCAFVFIKGLGIPMPLLGSWFGN
ncbi:MAG TPA: tripartite tricarboxylate transporter TctB family protein [Rhodocyclaceae bacterium]|nr:tripartite tricarboxylate transporter TctB family protein [Rhodocyclaceae bacterium]